MCHKLHIRVRLPAVAGARHLASSCEFSSLLLLYAADARGVIYGCANGCGYTGSFDEVTVHEAVCASAGEEGKQEGRPEHAQHAQHLRDEAQDAAAAGGGRQEIQVVALRASLTKFYAANSPHKMDKVDAIIDKFVDRGGGAEQVSKIDKSLQRTYGKGTSAAGPQLVLGARC